jgi:hypothetical protein
MSQWKCVFLSVLVSTALSCTDALGPGKVKELLPDGKVTTLSVDREYFRDELGRYVLLNGINVSGTSKLPVTPEPLDDPRKGPISFVGRPFPLEDADYWMDRIKNEMGFNSIRLVVMWEAVEHAGRGIFDEDYLNYIEEIVKKANDHGIYIVVNFHENLFSRYLYTNFSRNPEIGTQGSLEYMLSSLFPNSKTLEFDGRVTGDGAPRWAVEACLPHKNIDAPTWGMSKLLGNLGNDFHFFQIFEYVDKLIGAINLEQTTDEHGYPIDPSEQPEEEGPSLEEFLLDMISLLKAHSPSLTPFPASDTNDVLPIQWWENNLLSLDIGRCYGAFFAGDRVLPSARFEVKGKDVGIQEYLQGGYIDSWVEVVKRVKKYPNVVGYDLINEPPGGSLMLALIPLYFASNFDKSVVERFLVEAAGPVIGESLYRVIILLNLLPLMPSREYFVDKYIPLNPGLFNTFKNEHPDLCTGLKIPDNMGVWDCPPSTLPKGDGDPMPAQMPEACKTALLKNITDECWRDEFYLQYELDLRVAHGVDDLDLMGSLDLNLSFVMYLVDMYRKIGVAIVEEHPEAIIWLEEGSGALDSIIGGTFASVNLYKPEELDQIVFSPHWYPDIYPYFAINPIPRSFSINEWAVRDFTADLTDKMEASTYTFGRVPVVFGEFGTYFNYNYDSKEFWDTPGIEDSIANDYAISGHILNSYYEAFESMFTHRMLWCLSIDNNYSYGDLWNQEDFSILDPSHKLRGERAWARPYARFMSGKPLTTRFNSDYHKYDPDKGVAKPWREFQMTMGSKESDAPTEIYVPRAQYETGFYVWISDGRCVFDYARNALYWYPSSDAPGAEHSITIRPVQEGRESIGWQYFFRGDQMLVGNRN